MANSEQVVAAVLSNCLENGFQRRSLQFSDLGLDENLAPYFSQSVRWLVEEGLIRVREISELINGTAIVGSPAITSLGMQQLERWVETGEGQRQQVAEIVQATKAGDNSFRRAGNFVGGLLAAFAKSMG